MHKRPKNMRLDREKQIRTSEIGISARFKDVMDEPNQRFGIGYVFVDLIADDDID